MSPHMVYVEPHLVTDACACVKPLPDATYITADCQPNNCHNVLSGFGKQS